MSWHTRFQRLVGYLYICDNAGHVPNTPDTAQLWLITGIQDGDYKIGMGNSFSTVRDGAAI